jgi:hypothetical protein
VARQIGAFRKSSDLEGEETMYTAFGANQRGSVLTGLAAVGLLLAAPLAAVGADRMVLGEYFTATW